MSSSLRLRSAHNASIARSFSSVVIWSRGSVMSISWSIAGRISRRRRGVECIEGPRDYGLRDPRAAQPQPTKKGEDYHGGHGGHGEKQWFYTFFEQDGRKSR